jgi:hypothetical protein
VNAYRHSGLFLFLPLKYARAHGAPNECWTALCERCRQGMFVVWKARQRLD